MHIFLYSVLHIFFFMYCVTLPKLSCISLNTLYEVYLCVCGQVPIDCTLISLSRMRVFLSSFSLSQFIYTCVRSPPPLFYCYIYHTFLPLAICLHTPLPVPYSLNIVLFSYWASFSLFVFFQPISILPSLKRTKMLSLSYTSIFFTLSGNISLLSFSFHSHLQTSSFIIPRYVFSFIVKNYFPSFNAYYRLDVTYQNIFISL